MTPIRARAFFGAATEGSFSGGAAKRLNVSQPSVTTQVGSIERHYKVELFHRTGRGVRLSPGRYGASAHGASVVYELG
jgi:DNA-binding transcriptional LysR family regulator